MYLFLATAIGWAAPPEGLWIGSTSSGNSAKIVVLDVRGTAVTGSLELQEGAGFRTVSFTGKFEGGRLTADEPRMSLAVVGTRMSGEVVSGGRKIAVSLITSTPSEMMPGSPPPAPAPAPAAQTVTPCTSCEEGWAAVDRDPRAALAVFEKAAAEQPESAEAWYGRGYVLSVLGDTDGANAALCRALGLADTLMTREIQGLLASRRMSCRAR